MNLWVSCYLSIHLLCTCISYDVLVVGCIEYMMAVVPVHGLQVSDVQI